MCFVKIKDYNNANFTEKYRIAYAVIPSGSNIKLTEGASKLLS
jgi:hypothetical protein